MSFEAVQENVYNLGSVVRLTAEFTDPETSTPDALVYVDPTTVTVRVERPNGTVAHEGDATKTAAGHYRYDQEADMPGRWGYRFRSTGNYQDAKGGTFFVRSSSAYS